MPTCTRRSITGSDEGCRSGWGLSREAWSAGAAGRDRCFQRTRTDFEFDNDNDNDNETFGRCCPRAQSTGPNIPMALFQSRRRQFQAATASAVTGSDASIQCC